MSLDVLYVQICFNYFYKKDYYSYLFLEFFGFCFSGFSTLIISIEYVLGKKRWRESIAIKMVSDFCATPNCIRLITTLLCQNHSILPIRIHPNRLSAQVCGNAYQLHFLYLLLLQPLWSCMFWCIWMSLSYLVVCDLMQHRVYWFEKLSPHPLRMMFWRRYVAWRTVNILEHWNIFAMMFRSFSKMSLKYCVWPFYLSQSFLKKRCEKFNNSDIISSFPLYWNKLS